jgi:hypothetical protein
MLPALRSRGALETPTQYRHAQLPFYPPMPPGTAAILVCVRAYRSCGLTFCRARPLTHSVAGSVMGTLMSPMFAMLSPSRKVHHGLYRAARRCPVRGTTICSLIKAAPSSLEDTGYLKARVALFVSCDTQDEVDRLWDALFEDGQAIECSWLVDRYGISWNIVPQDLGELLHGHDLKRSQRGDESYAQDGQIEHQRAAPGIRGGDALKFAPGPP